MRFVRGSEPLAAIVERAEAAPLPSFASRYDTPETHRLVKLCRELQRACGGSPFFLACRTVGKLLDIDHRTASRRLHMLCTDGVLCVVKPGDTHRATRYRYVADAEHERKPERFPVDSG